MPRAEQRDGARPAFEAIFEPVVVRALLAQLPTAVLLVDRSGRVTYANEAAGHLQARSVPSAWPDVAQLPPVLEWPVARALLTGDGLGDAPITIAGTGGSERHMRVSITLVQSGDAEGTAAVLTLADVSDRRRWETWGPVIASLVRL
ncbi:PAS domain-containing protein [Gemmatirosa kalamazoonensis]|uniref:PAS domain-containing protein n=1 Tax=Gemmatirosa kalamazoonensis TaxID=861299 RepID=UPI0004B14ADB|nr:PAS domain-containing protein [Gemmatirosa kalamazoonensis]